MQYNGYEIQKVEYGYIIRDSNGKYIISVENDTAAKDLVDEINSSDTLPLNKCPIDWYKRFERYCKSMRGRVYPDGSGRFGCVFEKTLYRYIKSFEKHTNTKVHISTEYHGGEYFYMVDSVEEY